MLCFSQTNEYSRWQQKMKNNGHLKEFLRVSIASKNKIDNNYYGNDFNLLKKIDKSFNFSSEKPWLVIKAVGGDVVGMSTVQENIAAVHCGMKVFAISVVTDLGIREDNNTITHEEVLEAANAAEPKLTLIISDLVKQIS